MHPFLQRLSPPVPIAHRGGAALAPENTLFAFTRAVREHGARMIELDLQISRDGELIVFHDERLERCTDGEGRVADWPTEALLRLDAGYRFSDGWGFPFRGRGVRLCTLDQLLEVPELAAVPLNVELKADVPGIEHALVTCLRRHRAIERVCIGSEHDGLAARIAAAAPEACHFYPRDALAAFVLAVYGGEPLPKDERYQVLDAPLAYEGFRVVQPPLIDAARREGKWLNVWTVDEEADLRELVALGVGGIMTDRPDLLQRVLAFR